MASSLWPMASIRPVGVLGSAVGQTALSWSSACAIAFLSSSRMARWASVEPNDWPIRQPCGLPAAEVGFDTAAGRGASRNRPRPTGTAARVIAASVSAAVAARRLDRRVGAAIAVRVGAEHAVVEVVVGIGPERVIRIRIEGVVDEVVVGVRPEQRADKSDHDRKRAMPPPLRVEEAALERRVRQRARAGIAGGGHARKTLVAQNAAGEGARV